MKTLQTNLGRPSRPALTQTTGGPRRPASARPRFWPLCLLGALAGCAGGTVGIGTVLYAVSIGPLLHLLLPRLQVGRNTSRESVLTASGGDAPFTEPEGR